MVPTPVWRYPFFTPAFGDRARELAAAIETPLRLEHRSRWDPEEEYWGDPGDPIEPGLREVFAGGPREAFEQEQRAPDGLSDEDPILDAIELADRGERERARALLGDLLVDEPHCLDAHVHLGLFAYAYAAGLALPHYEAGVAIGERSLPEQFNGVLSWGRIDNRPFLRCLQGYGLCLWRLDRFEQAEEVFRTMLWLNPTDNQGARELVEDCRTRESWKPAPLGPSPDGWRRGHGRRALLDLASPILEAPSRTPADSEIRASFAPLVWLLEKARDDGGLPLTQTGALGRVIVREAALRFPGWWDNAELFGPPNREADLLLLEELHDFTRRARLLRKRKSRLLPTARAKSGLDDPGTLIDVLAAHLFTGDPFECELTELTAAVLLAERDLDRDRLTEIVFDALREDWRTGDGPLSERHVAIDQGAWLHLMIGLGPVAEQTTGPDLSLDQVGAELIARSLRRRAVGPGWAVGQV